MFAHIKFLLCTEFQSWTPLCMTPFFTSKISRSVFVQENTSTLVMYTWPRQQQRRALQRAKAKHQWKTKKKADAAFRAVEEEAGSPAQMTCGTNACSPFFVVFFESTMVQLLGRLHTGDANTVEQGGSAYDGVTGIYDMRGGEMFVFWRKSKESIIAPLIDEPQVFMGQHHRLPAGLLSLCLCIVLFFTTPEVSRASY